MPRQHPMTLTGKILLDHAIGPRRTWVEAGDVLRVKVDWTLASELAWNGMDRTYAALGRPKIHDPERFYLAIDHTVDAVSLAKDPRVQALARLSRDFAQEAGLRHFYDANETILHTAFYRHLVRPGDVVLGADSHTSSHGGIGAFAIGLGGADVAVAMVLGESWIEVPEAVAVEYRGELPFGLTGKDVILRTLGELGRNTVALERSVEYLGEAVRSFSADMRFTICNMTAEFGGLNGIFAPDDVTAVMVESRSREPYRGGKYFAPDLGAPYVARCPIDLAALAPQVAKPFAPDNVVSVEDVAGTALQGTFIGACTTTEEELLLAALVLEQCLSAGAPVQSTKRLVVPGSREIAARLRERGLLAIFERGGFRIGEPGCSMCLGVASDRAGEGEHWLSSQNRNFHNRMGKGSIAYLASAATVAASSRTMEITDPRPALAGIDRERWLQLLGRPTAAPSAVVLSEPLPAAAPAKSGSDHPEPRPAPEVKTIVGRVQRFGSHVDTDAIIPGEYCHIKEMAELGRVCFKHVRPEFFERAQAGRIIVVAEEGWGSGSSREQAVWALKGAGIAAVIARSFAFIHKRNLVNEALPYFVVNDEGFYEACGEDTELEIDLRDNSIRVLSSGAGGRVFTAAPLSPMVRALAREGGIIPAVRRHGPATFSRLQQSERGR